MLPMLFDWRFDWADIAQNHLKASPALGLSIVLLAFCTWKRMTTPDKLRNVLIGASTTYLLKTGSATWDMLADDDCTKNQWMLVVMQLSACAHGTGMAYMDACPSVMTQVATCVLTLSVCVMAPKYTGIHLCYIITMQLAMELTLRCNEPRKVLCNEPRKVLCNEPPKVLCNEPPKENNVDSKPLDSKVLNTNKGNGPVNFWGRPPTPDPLNNVHLPLFTSRTAANSSESLTTSPLLTITAAQERAEPTWAPVPPGMHTESALKSPSFAALHPHRQKSM